MSEGTQNAFTVTVLPDSSAAQLKTSIASDSSNISATDGNNVSFVNITYTIQPHPFRSRFKELPSKKILDDVRSVKKYLHVLYRVYDSIWC